MPPYPDDAVDYGDEEWDGLQGETSATDHPEPIVPTPSEELVPFDPYKITPIDICSLGPMSRLPNSFDGENWDHWCGQMTRLFNTTGAASYVDGTLGQPDLDCPRDLALWKKNDNLIQTLITQNIKANQSFHVNNEVSAYSMWHALCDVFDIKGHQTGTEILRSLFRLQAQEGDDIGKHVFELKQIWECLNNLGEDAGVSFSPYCFKNIIASSLPSSWDNITDPYLGLPTLNEKDSKKLMGPQQFIGFLKDKYQGQQARTDGSNNQAFSANTNSSSSSSMRARPPRKPKSKLLTDRIGPKPHSNPKSEPWYNYTLCRTPYHTTENCRNKNKPKCDKCGYHGCDPNRCQGKREQKRLRGSNDGRIGKNKKQKVEEIPTTAYVEEIDDAGDHLVAYPMNVVEDGEYNRFDLYWLADSAASTHICTERDAFINYMPLETTSIQGVGGIRTPAQGRGSVKLESEINGCTYTLKLQNVLHIPNNPHNLLSLGKWDENKGIWEGGNGKIILKTCTG